MNYFDYLVGFLILKVKYDDEKFRPSYIIDKKWKEMLLETQDYIKLCERICKKLNKKYRFIHREELSFSEEDKHLFTKTKERFKEEFGDRSTFHTVFPHNYDEFRESLYSIKPEYGFTKVCYLDLGDRKYIFKFKNNNLTKSELTLLIQEKIHIPHYNFRFHPIEISDTENLNDKLVFIRYILRGC